MHPKLVQKKALEAAKAMAEGLARVEEAVARLERKVDTLLKGIKVPRKS